MNSFHAHLEQRIDLTRSWLCAGVDISPEGLGNPKASLQEVKDHSFRLIDAVRDLAAAFKPNLAFFERWGADGLVWLTEVIDHIGNDHLIIGDGKRGDIGNTARQYAISQFDHFGMDAVTVNPYMGADSIKPFLERPEKGAFVLCRTSNPSAAEFQSHRNDGEMIYESVVKTCLGLNVNKNIGLVVGATQPDELRTVRRLAPGLPLLIPGVGAQGGDLKSSVQIGNDGGIAIINVSRGIAFAGDHSPQAMRKAAFDYVQLMRRYRNES